MKKDNKGFSLVELIVVVLIMAIVAVALAPQVMKWVENSRKATDVTNYGHVAEALEVAYAKEEIYKAGACHYECTAGTWGNCLSGTGGLTASGDFTKATEVGTVMTNTLGNGWTTKMGMKSKKYGGTGITIKVAMDADGHLLRDPNVVEDIES